MGITGMNHAVLYVRDARRQQRFYTDVLGFRSIVDDPDGQFVFMRAPDSLQPPRHRLLHDRRPGRAERGRAHARSACTTSPGRCRTLDELEEMRDAARRGRRARRRQRPRRQQEPLRQGPRRPRVRGDVARRPPSTGATRSTRRSSSRSTSRRAKRKYAEHRRVTVEFGPVTRQTVAEQVRARLAERDRAPASSRPGRRCRPSAGSCEEFGVARTSVREAIQGLVSLGVRRAPRQPHRTSPSTCPRSCSPRPIRRRLRKQFVVPAVRGAPGDRAADRRAGQRAGDRRRARGDPPQRARSSGSACRSTSSACSTASSTR